MNKETDFKVVQMINQGKGYRRFYIQRFYKNTNLCVKPEEIYCINDTGVDWYKKQGILRPIDKSEFYFNHEEFKKLLRKSELNKLLLHN